MTPALSWATAGNCRSVVITHLDGRVVVFAAHLGREVARNEGPTEDAEKLLDKTMREAEAR